jgi:sarcosine oxidase, subunit gamma
MARMQGHGDDGAAAEKVAVTDLPTSARFSLRAGAEGRAAAADALGMHLPARIGARVTAGGAARSASGRENGSSTRPTATEPRSARPPPLPRRSPSSTFRTGRSRSRSRVPPHSACLPASAPATSRALPVGAGCRTLLDSVQVVLLREGADRFTVEIGRSFAPHLRALFDLAVREIRAGL